MQNSPDALPIAFVLIFYAFVILVGLGIQAIVCYFLYRACAVIPENYRLASPGLAFLLMIPLVGFVWIFIYTKNLSNSFVNFFSSIGGARDDCGEKLGMWWGICTVCSIIPCLGAIAGIASLVLMIMYLVKVNECRSMVLNVGSGGFPGPAAPYKTPGSPHNPYGY